MLTLLLLCFAGAAAALEVHVHLLLDRPYNSHVEVASFGIESVDSRVELALLDDEMLASAAVSDNVTAFLVPSTVHLTSFCDADVASVQLAFASPPVWFALKPGQRGLHSLFLAQCDHTVMRSGSAGIPLTLAFKTDESLVATSLTVLVAHVCLLLYFAVHWCVCGRRSRLPTTALRVVLLAWLALATLRSALEAWMWQLDAMDVTNVTLQVSVHIFELCLLTALFGVLHLLSKGWRLVRGGLSSREWTRSYSLIASLIILVVVSRGTDAVGWSLLNGNFWSIIFILIHCGGAITIATSQRSQLDAVLAGIAQLPRSALTAQLRDAVAVQRTFFTRLRVAMAFFIGSAVIVGLCRVAVLDRVQPWLGAALEDVARVLSAALVVLCVLPPLPPLQQPLRATRFGFLLDALCRVAVPEADAVDLIALRLLAAQLQRDATRVVKALVDDEERDAAVAAEFAQLIVVHFAPFAGDVRLGRATDHAEITKK